MRCAAGVASQPRAYRVGRRRRVFAIAATLAAILTIIAKADDSVYTGAVLLKDFQVCAQRPGDYFCGRAANYVKGFAKRLLQGHVGDPRAPQICLAQDVGVAELTEVVRGFLDAHPERHDELAVWLVRDAMIGAYPCTTR